MSFTAKLVYMCQLLRRQFQTAQLSAISEDAENMKTMRQREIRVAKHMSSQYEGQSRTRTLIAR